MGFIFPGSIEDWSFELFNAFQHASLILAWQENLEAHEMPPEWMWPFSFELEEWFEEVKIARDQKYGGGSEEDLPMVDNELSSRFRD